MRIGIDGRLWGESGVGRYTRNLVWHLEKIDRKNSYFLFVPSKYLPEIKLGSNWDVIPCDIKWHSISEQIEFPSLLNKYSLDLMHFTYFSMPIFYNRPYVITIHDLVIHHFPTGKASTHMEPIYRAKVLAYKKIISTAAKKSKKIIAVSQATKDEIVDHLDVNPEKIEVVYEASEKLPVLEGQYTPPNLPKKYILYVGNAYPHKNLENLISAFNKLSAENTEIKLILAGRRDYFYDRLLLGLNNDSIVFMTPDDGELLRLYKNAVCLVMPSKMEGFGLPVLEAMENKCLVAVSDIAVFHEICDEGALYFDQFDSTEIGQVLNKIITMKTLEKTKYINSGLVQSKKFSFDKMARETLKIYESSASIRQNQ